MIEPDFDWVRFWVHFVFGALLGGVIGGVLWLQNWHPGLSPWFWIGGFSLAVALLGGVCGDRFWARFLESLRWLG